MSSSRAFAMAAELGDPEPAGAHEQETIHPLTVANELRALTDRVAKLKRQLALMPHVEGLRECLVKAQVALEIGVVCVKEMEHECE